MLKAKEHKIEDSNIEGIGTDADKKCRETAAATEKAWKKIKKKNAATGKKELVPGFWAWRIEQFKVVANQDAVEHGIFYNADSYIVLKGRYEDEEKKGKVLFDVHFWLGQNSSQDEKGTAAYKTVELDDFLGGDPVQHREVSGCESKMFLSYFPHGVRLLKGGVDSGFKHVSPETFVPRLLWIKGRKNVRVIEVPIKTCSLNSGDVFVLDCGLNLYQYQGKACGKNEKLQAAKLQRMIDDERKGKPECYVFSQLDDPSKDDNILEFFSYFAEDLKEHKITDHKAGAKVPVEVAVALMAEVSDDVGGDDKEIESVKKLFQLSDASGELKFTEVASGTVTKDLLDTKDVFVFDIGMEVFLWIGKGASASERKKGMRYATDYLTKFDRPDSTPISQIYEGGENEVFEGAFDDS